MKKIAIAAQEKFLEARAQQLSSQLNIPMVSVDTHEFPYLLLVTPKRIEIQKISEDTVGPLFVDFLSGKMGYRISRNRARHELIARAVGYKPNIKLKIIDATAGLGRDGLILAMLGCEVLMLERSPLLAVLLEDGLQRAQRDLDFKKLSLQLLQIDALSYLQELSPPNFPDVIYLDPMYPERNKSALVKKELRYMHELIGQDADAEQLLEMALTHVNKRVVVKRPRLAETFLRKPDFALMGTSTRFDVYMKTLLKHSEESTLINR